MQAPETALRLPLHKVKQWLALKSAYLMMVGVSRAVGAIIAVNRLACKCVISNPRYVYPLTDMQPT